MLRSRAAHQPQVMTALDKVGPKLKVGDWKLLHTLGKNMEPVVFGELVVEFAKQLEDSNHNSLQRDIMGTKTILTQI